MKINNIIIVSIASLVSIASIWYIMHDNIQKLQKHIIKHEQSLRDSILKEIKADRAKQDKAQIIIDSLTYVIDKYQTELTKQIIKIKYETIKGFKDYRDSSNSDLLERLRTE